MKKILCLVTIFVLVLTLVACGKDENSTNPQDNANTIFSTTEKEQNENKGNKISIPDVESAPSTDPSKFEYRDVDSGIAITNYNGNDRIVAIPESIDGKNVVAIDNNSFINNKTMLGLKIANSITQIGSNAFENCTSLKVFVSGTTLESISEFAFNGCKELSDVKLNDGLKSLGMLSFGGTNMSELYIPESVETIDMPFTANADKTLKIISTSGSEAENYVSLDGENFNLIFEAK